MELASDSDNNNLSNNPERASYDYTYRADGKRTGLNEVFNTTTQRTNDYVWTYDDAGRLITEALNSNDNSVDQTESYILDLVGNRIRRTINKPGTGSQVTDIYTFNTTDQLLSESRYNGLFPSGTPSGSATKTTTYGWNATQQTSKAVLVPSTSTVTQSMSYGLTGQLSRVVTGG